MKFEIIVSYSRGFGYAYIKDEEQSVPTREISNEEASKYMNFLADLGCKRHETKSQIFYDEHMDSNHVREYIFYK